VVQERLGEAVVEPEPSDLAAAARDGLEGLKHEVEAAEETTWANFCLTDGESIIATRYASPADTTAQSLYVGEAGSFVAGDGAFVGTPDPEGDAATIVASEPLFEDDRVWRAVPRNHLVTVGPDGETGSSRSTSTSRPDTDRRDDGPVIADAPPATTAKGLQQSV
jgi:hypothetical protein